MIYSRQKFKLLNEAATLVVALFFAFPINGLAKNLKLKEVLGRAQQKFLARQRVGALRILREIGVESLGPTEKEEWLEAEKVMATRFFSDKGQKLYEQGLSQLMDQPQLALGSLNEAQKIEQSHVLVAIAQIRAKYATEDCSAAKKILDDEDVPFQVLGSESAELRLLVGICLKDSAVVEALLKRNSSENPLSAVMQKLAAAWLKYLEEESEKAEALLKEARALESQNLAVLYFGAKWPLGSNMKSKDEGEKFLQRCKDFAQSVRRRTISMAELCYRRAEIENELKKIPIDATPEED